MRNFSKKSIGLVLIFTILIAIFMPTVVNAESSVNRIGTSRIGSIVVAYTGGNSQVYVNKITKSDGTVVRYVYSKNFIVTSETIAKLKSVLTSEYSSLIPDNYSGEDNVGIMVCSDPLLVDSMDENWTSSEWVAKNIVAAGEVENVTNKDGDGTNQTAISNSHSLTAIFNEIKNNIDIENRLSWESREREKKASWDAAEAAMQEEDPSYVPQEYVGSEYVPMDYGTINETDIQNLKTLENNQIEISTRTVFARSYEFDAGKLVEITNVTSIHQVASIFTTHTIIDGTEEEPTYEFIDNTANQTYTINQDDALTFRINADFSLFENGGKVFVDGTETNEFTASSGSTVITFAKDYVSSLSEGEHTLKVAFNNGGEATTKFTVAKANTEAEETTNNPKTGDNIITVFSIFAIATLGAFTTLKLNINRKTRKH